MKLEEILGVTLNTGILSIFYTALGGVLSYVLYYFFDEHDSTWETQSTFYQVGMVSAELIVVGIIAIWSSYIIREAPPIFPVSKELDEFVDTYISGIFFVFAMFIFLDNLGSKLQYLYHKFLGKRESHFLPRKTDENKTR